MPQRARLLLGDLLWPAVAGNVAWSFFSLAVNLDKTWRDSSAWANLASLLLLAVYLLIDWGGKSSLGEPRRYHWFFDGPFLASVTLFAIAAQAGKDFLEILVCAICGFAIAGHIAGVWTKNRAESRYYRGALVVANALGPLTVGSRFWSSQPRWAWNVPIALAFVLLAWLVVRLVVIAERQMKARKARLQSTDTPTAD